jgi:DNA-binding winged helix-turn-helix (wHTH) protein
MGRHDALQLPPDGLIRLGSLEVHPGARTLFIGAEPVDLGGRAFDLLMVLLDARGAIVTKDDLLRLVWPTVTVIESNLKVQLSLLRRALGPERWRIKTISGRGYLLVTEEPQPLPQPDKPLVIVVEADRGTQEMIVRALADVAQYFEGMRRFTLAS